jgi:hypothetical protein
VTRRRSPAAIHPLLLAGTWLLAGASAGAQPYAIPQAVFPGGGGTSAAGTFVITGTIAQGVGGETSSGGTHTVTGGFSAADTGTPGSAPPTLTITAPTTGGTFTATAALLPLAGTASDDVGIAEVTWASDRGPSGVASGTTSWSVPGVPLYAGTNVLTVTARDVDTPSHSTTATLTVTVTQFSYYLAEGATGLFWDLDLAIANPNGIDAPVTLTFLKEDATVVTQTTTLPATSRTTIAIETIPGLEQMAVSTVVTSTLGLPLVVERSMFWLGAAYYGAHGGTSVAGPARRWMFAEGSQGYFDTFLLLANANPVAATVTVQFFTEWKGTVTRTLPLPPTSRTNVFTGAIPELADTSFAIVVDADQPIIAERAMYFGGPRFWEGGHESVGVTGPATEWFLAEGATGYFDEYVLVGNPNETAATVTLTYLLDTGQTVTRTRTMAPHSRLTVFVADEDPLLARANVSTRVRSDVPVIAERAMYWPAPFATWAEAHNSFGVTETALKWGLAEGRVGGPLVFETYILLANPGAAAAQVRLTFLRTNGTTVVKDYTVAPTSRFNVPVNVFVPELQDESFSAVIEVLNGVPIAVERAMYSNDTAGTRWAAGTNATAVRLP